MGIQSTKDITREEAIERIEMMAGMIKRKNYKGVDDNSSETDIDLQEFIDNWEPIDLSNVSNWTDIMLEDYMDNPFFRFSKFENYLIKKEY